MENINPSLAPMIRPISSLRQDPQNARTHGDRSVDALKTSLTRYGQNKPVVARRDGVVIAGNGMLEAAKALGWKKLAVSDFRGTDEEAKAYALADNRTAELSAWDEGVLAHRIDEVAMALPDFAPELLGFNAEEVADLLGRADALPNPGPGGAPSGSSAASVQANPQSANPPPEAPPSHVRMVQLFLNESNHPPFLEKIQELSKIFGTANVTDTVLAVVDHAWKSLSTKDH